jgi:hypothetical protein
VACYLPQQPPPTFDTCVKCHNPSNQGRKRRTPAAAAAAAHVPREDEEEQDGREIIRPERLLRHQVASTTGAVIRCFHIYSHARQR